MNSRLEMGPETLKDDTSIASASSSVKWLLQNSLLVSSTSTVQGQDGNDLQESSGSTINWLLNKAHIAETNSFTDSSGGADGDSWIDEEKKKEFINSSSAKALSRSGSRGITSSSGQNMLQPISSPLKNQQLTLMQQALQKSPYNFHNRQRKRLLREQTLREFVSKDKEQIISFKTTEKHFPKTKISPPPSWSLEIPPKSGLFDDIKKETKRQQLVKSIISRALHKNRSLQVVIGKSPISTTLKGETVGNITSSFDNSDMVKIRKGTDLDSSIALNDFSFEVALLPENESFELVEPGLTSISNDKNEINCCQIPIKEGAKTSSEFIFLSKFLPDIEEKIDSSSSLYGKSMEAAMNSLISMDIDPLYRILKEEGERLNDARRLFTSIPKDRPLASVPDSRRKYLLLNCLSNDIFQPFEAKEVASFNALPSHLWPTCRLVYFLLLSYHNLLFAGKVVSSNQVIPMYKLDISVANKNKSGSPKEKNSSIIIFSPNSKSKKSSSRLAGKSTDLPSKSHISRPKTTGRIANRNTAEKLTVDEMSQIADMDVFWKLITQQRRRFGINMISSLESFSWIMLKQLLAMPVELCYALYLVETSNSVTDGIDSCGNDGDRIGLNEDFYSAFPDEYIPLLRDAARARSLHPSFLAPICAPAARLCSWARRVVAGIFTVKQAMPHIPLSLSGQVATLHPLYSAPLDGDSSFDVTSNDEEGITFIPIATKADSPVREHQLVSVTSKKRFEQLMKYRYHSASAPAGDTSFFFVSAIDGSEASHIAFVTAISLARPFDRVDVLACQKPRGSDYPAGNVNGPVAMNVLKSHYEGLVRGMTNSPSHRVVVLDTSYVSSTLFAENNSFISDTLENKDGEEEVTVSFNSNFSPEKRQQRSSIAIQNNEWSIETNETYLNAKGGAEELVTKALQVNADFCVLSFGWGRNILRTENGSVLEYLNNREDGKSFALVITSYRSNPISSLSTFSSSAKMPSISFLPSRYVICIDDSDSSEAAFAIAKKVSRPSDLLFLIHLSVVQPSKSAAEHSIHVSKAASVAQYLMQKYRLLGHNLHVEPFTIPYYFSRDEMKLIVATQLKQTAALFGPTFLVMGANKITIDYLACGNNFLSTIVKSNVVGASKLEDDTFEGDSKKNSRKYNLMMPPLSVSSAVINFEGENDAPAYSYIVVTR